MTNWAAGMRLTADRMEETDLIGRVVFAATRNASQSIPSGADVVANAVQWDAVDLDALAGWNPSRPTRWTAPRPGWWTLQGAVGFNASTGGTMRECCWYVNGSLISMGRSRPLSVSSIAGSPLTVNARAVPRLMSTGDYVELVPAQNSGAALDTATGSFRPYISITYSGPA